MSRLFTALTIPPLESLRQVARALQQADPRLRLESSERWHLTLNFLGEVDAERVPDLVQLLREATAEGESQTFDLQGLGAFPEVQHPRVLWVGIGGDAALRVLQLRLRRAVQASGLPAAEEFVPHLTLARIRFPPREGIAELLKRHTGTRFGNVSVNEVFLYESNLQKPGQPYRVRARFPLRIKADSGR
ncbi:MAG: RNA 2',3'-cyclic phosphodiesterase [Planctomycetaceae bacterium]|jgi:2'-5' RNA ligase